MTPKRWWALAAGVFALAVASSGIGILNGFTYDDQFIIQTNQPLHLLRLNWWHFFGRSYWPVLFGGDGYRPLTILLYSIEWTLSHGSAWLFHAVNIVLYGAVSMAVFALADAILPVAAAWIVAALFAVNPVHVEAVANIVGQSELWVGLILIGATAIYVRRRNAGLFSHREMIAFGVLYAAACCIKENGIVLPALLLLAEMLVVRDNRALRDRLIALRPFGLCLGLIAASYLWARSEVLFAGVAGFQAYVPFDALRVTAPQRVMTMLGLVPEWIRLLLWPVRLSSEYGPPEYPIASGPSWSQLPGCALLLAILGLGVVLRRRSPATSFGIGWLVLALLPVSNFLVPAGILIAERTLFLPSVGALIAAGTLVPYLASKLATRAARYAAVTVLTGLLIAGAWRSLIRTRVWRDNDALFQQAVLDAPYVYRTHYMLGGWDFIRNRKQEGEAQYLIALKLFPADPFVSYNLAIEYNKRGLYGPAEAMFRRTLSTAPDFTDAYGAIAVALAEQGKFADARGPALDALRHGSGDPKVLRSIIEVAANRSRMAAPTRSAASGGAVRHSGKVPGLVQNTGRDLPPRY